MAEIDTAAEREQMDMRSFHDAGHYAHGMYCKSLDEIDRLRAENQRLKLAALTADRESMGLEAENQRLREALRAADRLMRTAATDPRQSVNAANAADVYSDGNITLAAWYPKYDNDRSTFNECRRLDDHKLRATIESTGGGE